MPRSTYLPSKNRFVDACTTFEESGVCLHYMRCMCNEVHTRVGSMTREHANRI